MTTEPLSPIAAAAHLEPQVWRKVNRLILSKAISEFAHELLIRPTLVRIEGDWGHYLLTTDQPGVEYRFRARILSLEHWWIDKESLRKSAQGKAACPDALSFIVELQTTLGISDEVLPEYLEELAATLYGAAHKHARPGPSAAALCRATFQEIETAMLEGHPIFVANNGRIGFHARDYPAYAPELGSPIQLVWLAVKRELSVFSCVEDLSYAELIEQELDEATQQAFACTLAERGFDPAAYRVLPVHPWQWTHCLAQLFASDLARGDLVYLGPGSDLYLAQQSIRTLFNISHPHKRYVKTALSILNMGFTRGIPASIVHGAGVNEWIERLVHGDPYLRAQGFRVLREVAFVAYRHRHYERVVSKRSSPYKEMLGALWRESPTRQLAPGRRLMTMAALMHVDRDGAALLPELIRASGLSVEAWLRRYLRGYLKPLLHCFYRHHLVFSPHCENIILVLEDHAVAEVIIKDIAEDIGVLNAEEALPEKLRHLALKVPEDVMTLSIFTDAFDCVFRFLAQILLEHAGYPTEAFWSLVAACVREYEAEQPQLSAKFRRYDLFAPTFLRNCLNRLQLTNNRMMVDLNAPEPVDSLQFVGTLHNPIAPFFARAATAMQEGEIHDAL